MRAAIILLVLSMQVARADPSPPCKGCVLVAPKHEEAAPLLVVLHGDREHAPAAARRWKAAAKQRGWVLLSLECPKELGCTDSWWKWNGEPSWVTDQVAAVTKLVAIDPTRIYLAGWSGGATYIGMRALSWGDVFAAVVIHGGGHAPGSECPARALPGYFLVGDANPLHRSVKALRDWFEGCDQEFVWDLVKRGDHDKENRALDRSKAVVILDWLTQHARTAPSTSAHL